MDGVELLGQIDKSHDMARWIEVLRGCDLGALLSVSEGVPISFLEFLRTGVLIIGTNVNGIPDIVTNGVGISCRKTLRERSSSEYSAVSLSATRLTCLCERPHGNGGAW